MPVSIPEPFDERGGNLTRDSHSTDIEVDFDILITGAGCAGMSLARWLMKLGYAGRVGIFDSRADFSREQRWCTWGPLDPDLEAIASRRWYRWQAIDQKGRPFDFKCVRTPYTEFIASEFLTSISSRIAKQPNFTLTLNTQVGEIHQAKGCFDIKIGDRVVHAKSVVDARNDGSKTDTMKNPDEVWLWQSFVGMTIAADKPVFDPTCATLMDFRGDIFQAAKDQFIYVLPYSPYEALIECTVVDRSILPLDLYRRVVREYVAKLGIERWILQSEEIGVIPMTTQKRHTNDGTIRLGTSAGAIKPSTGYGFARIQKQAELAAMRLCGQSSGDIPVDHETWRRALIDDIFLDVLAKRPGKLSPLMTRMFRKLPGDLIIRFLSEQTDQADDFCLMAAVGDIGFALPAMQRLAAQRKAR